METENHKWSKAAGSMDNLPRLEGKTKEKRKSLDGRQRIKAAFTHRVPFCAPLGKVYLTGDCGYHRRIHFSSPNIGDGVCRSIDQSLKTGGTIHRRHLEAEMITRNLMGETISEENQANLNNVD